MRVLHSLLDPRVGGPNRRALQVARRLRPRGVESSFLIPTGSDEFEREAMAAGFEVFRMDLPRIRGFHSLRETLRFFVTFPLKVRRVRTLIDEHGIDVVHVNGPHNFTVATGASLSSASVLWHLNDCVTPFPVSTLVSLFAPRLADELVVTSSPVAEYFGIPPSSVARLYPPVAVDKYADGSVGYSVREEFDIDQPGPVIAVVGNVNPVKGHDVLIDAVDEVAPTTEPFTVLIVGKRLESRQRYYADLKERIEDAGLDETFRFVGWRSDVADILRDVDLLAVPSRTESGPMVVLEALAAGCPVVTTDVGIVSEVLDDSCAWIVEPGDPSALGAALRDALDSPDERVRRAGNGFERVAETFTLDQATDRHYEVYTRATSSIE